MVETSLVYIHRVKPTKAFVGCGVVLSGDCIATCRHVWRAATAAFGDAAAGEPRAEVEYPQFWHEGVDVTSGVSLADPCRAERDGPEPDLVLLQPDAIPDRALRLSPASLERFETGNGYAYAGLPGRDPTNPSLVQEVNVPGVIASTLRSDRRRQFTGVNQQSYWTDRGSSGSPVFLETGEQLAGIVSLSETARKSGESPIHEAFVVPGTVIRRYLDALMQVRKVAESEKIPATQLQPILDAIGAGDVPLADIPERLRQFVETARARGAERVAPSNDGVDIDAVIGAARDKLGVLDVGGARAVLQAKIAEEETARRTRLLPLLKEHAAIERLAFDHDAAISLLTEITALSPDDIWAWIDLGRERLTTGSVDGALASFRSALGAAERTGHQRELSVSHYWMGSVLEAQGDLTGALAAYRKSLQVMEPLAAMDPDNTQWQRDLSVSHNRIGNLLMGQGDLSGALASFREDLFISERLVARDPGNAEAQRDLSVSHNNIGEVLVAEGDLQGALEAYRKDLVIAEMLVSGDSSNIHFQRDLSISHNNIGDVLMAQGDLSSALIAFRTSHAIIEKLVARDAGNTQFQHDLSISHNNIGDLLVAQGNLNDALAAYRSSLVIRELLAARDINNAQWQDDLAVILGRMARVLCEQRQFAEAVPIAQRALAQVRAAMARLSDDPRLERHAAEYQSLLHRATGGAEDTNQLPIDNRST